MPKPKKEAKKQGKAKKIILSISIAILFVLFVAYAIETIYPSPKYENFCTLNMNQYYNQSDCEANNGTWTDNLAVPDKTAPASVSGYCDTYTKCQEQYTAASNPYNRNVFFISLVVGILTIIISVILAVESVSSGLMAGGAILVIYGTIRYWGSLSNIWRTLMLALALGILIYLGYKKLNN